MSNTGEIALYFTVHSYCLDGNGGGDSSAVLENTGYVGFYKARVF